MKQYDDVNTQYYESAEGDFTLYIGHDAAHASDGDIPTAPKITISLHFNDQATGQKSDYYGCYFSADGAHPVLTDGKARNGRFEYLQLQQLKHGVYKTDDMARIFALVVYQDNGASIRFAAKNDSKSFVMKKALLDQTDKFTLA